MKILVLGSGGREHALVQKISSSKLVEKIFIAPSNGLIEKMNIKTFLANGIKSILEIDQILKFVESEKIDLTVVGPEAPLAEGIVNRFNEKGFLIVGPTREASQLEVSKVFSKNFMKKYQIPTARYEIFSESIRAKKFLENNKDTRWVIKVDELAQGKGVTVTNSYATASEAVSQFMERAILGFNAKNLVIEECLEGPEISFFALCDGEDFISLGSAEDHKRLYDNDLGPNTGGMGAISPAPALSTDDQKIIENDIIRKVLKGMRNEGTPFSGVLFVGLMKTSAGLKVLEFNTRFGDPETQVLLPLMESDLVPWLEAAAKGTIARLKEKEKFELKKLYGIHVVMAAHGYPGTEGKKVRIGDEVFISNDSSNHYLIFFAGVKLDGSRIVTNGGRVLGVTALSDSVLMAKNEAYDLIKNIEFKDAHYRRDIGAKFLRHNFHD